jgi:hypothetical protein
MAEMRIALDAGEQLNRNPNEPIIHLVEGEQPYLWIGNNAENDKMCFATLSNEKSLRRLAEAILTALNN